MYMSLRVYTYGGVCSAECAPSAFAALHLKDCLFLNVLIYIYIYIYIHIYIHIYTYWVCSAECVPPAMDVCGVAAWDGHPLFGSPVAFWLPRYFCLYMYIYTCIYIYIHVYRYKYVYVRYVYVRCMYVCRWLAGIRGISIYVHMYICIYIYIYMYIDINMYM